MDLVDEENDAALGLRHFVDDAFEAFLKFSLVLRACHECAHVERVELLVFQVLRHVAAHDALRQSLYDGRFARARLADKNGVVLGAAREDLQHAAYLFVAPDDGVEFAFARLAHEVAGIFFQSLVGVFRPLRGCFLPAAQFLNGLAQGLL